ncbi:replicative DNA helicase [Marispirochaeta sp.]|uniref:replicative DNA helicase n=1 Tax=Marispirochaeta sp. TaxID=2038653 RepID=UPI0029C83114|nr:replicative DNA helicase [Marispirochaeta sp.]
MPERLKDSVPPHNVEAEKAVLGAVFLNPDTFGTVLEQLRSRDFFKTGHRKIFDAMVSLFNKGETMDLITVTDELRNQGELESAGGLGYVSALTDATPTSANIIYYSGIVRSLSLRRNLLNIAHEMISDAQNDTIQTREIIEEAERRIFDIAEENPTGHYKTAGEVIARTIEAIERLYHTKDSFTGIPSGFADLDKMTSGFQKSEFIVIGARPSVGKTALALTMASNMAIRSKRPIGFFTLEMSDMALMQRLVAAEARIASDILRTGMLKPSDFHKLTEAAGRIYEAPLFIDDSPNIKLLDLRAQARRMRQQEKVEAIFVDYIGLVEPENKFNVPRHEQVAETSRSLKSLARELDIPIICLSQVGRQSEGKAPSLADLRESGSIEQDADVVMFLHRDRGEKEGTQDVNNVETELIVAKQRNGPVGTIKVAFIPKFTKFEAFSYEKV